VTTASCEAGRAAELFDEARNDVFRRTDLDVGMDDYLPKPIRPESLKRVLSAVRPGRVAISAR
jgi:CheY-like chemotaxis protein